ncbi:unnamed protein product [Symbiodinium sp. CCMP2592]|nr:unnamed protein product [Symbiodinium sp. CCMP2592]
MGRKRKAALEEDAHPKGKGKARVEPRVEEQHSPLFLTLVKKFALGKISAPEVQEIADAAVKSGSDAPDLTKLQVLGAHGNWNNSIHRDLMRTLTRDGTKAPTLREICTPCVVTDSSGEKAVKEKNIPIMLPHEWVQGGLLESLTASPGDLRKFWSQQRWDSKQFRRQADFFNSLDWEQDLPIPWVLHGDAAPYTEVDSLQVVSFRCMITSKKVACSEFLLAVMPKHGADQNTWTKLWDEIADSFVKLAKGKSGKTSLRKGIIMSISGDLEWFSAEFGWPTASSNFPCPYCGADNLFDEAKSVAPFTDMRATAAWRGMLRDPDETEMKPHALWRVPAVSFWTMKLDLLHMADLGHRLPKLNKTDIVTPKGYPVLKHIKGRKVRHFAGVAVAMAKLYSKSKKGQHRLALCQAAETFYNICDRPEWVYDDRTHRQLERCIAALLSHYGWLAKNAMQLGVMQYSIVQKHHLLAHYSDQCWSMSPRCCWAYGPESFMGIVKRIAVACCRGTPAHMQPKKILQKFSLSFDLLLKGWLQLDAEKDDETE